jgi:methylmalonyl-CoA mutase cobalamin-binding subunit
VVSKSAPKIVIAAPAGQHCEIEALALAIIAMECGWKSIYFGPNLSATDIAAVVKSNRARAVGLSINRLNEKSIVEGEISKLKKNLNGDIDLIICGNGKLPLDHLVKFEGIFVTRIKNFRQKLENLTIENAN